MTLAIIEVRQLAINHLSALLSCNPLLELLLVDQGIAPRVNDLDPHSHWSCRKQASSSGGRKKKSDLQAEAVAEMVEIGKQEFDLRMVNVSARGRNSPKYSTN
uniref:Uncharacterized protein n=1 Tax=Ananas comosus var. bracteatus TaxID=296719 RepID=A0A6V7PHV9_ANACO|nr:unnamed protein product [Ananas comosus var. bracteatus]